MADIAVEPALDQMNWQIVQKCRRQRLRPVGVNRPPEERQRTEVETRGDAHGPRAPQQNGAQVQHRKNRTAHLRNPHSRRPILRMLEEIAHAPRKAEKAPGQQRCQTETAINHNYLSPGPAVRNGTGPLSTYRLNT